MTCDPHWTAYVSALLVPVVAILGAVIAYRQWRTAQNKLKFDLFDRRFSVYDVARRFIAVILIHGTVKDEELQKFLVGTRETGWLLNDDIAKYLSKELYSKSLHLQVLDKELSAFPVGPERSANVLAQSEIKTWLMQQYEVMDGKFSPFLRLSH